MSRRKRIHGKRRKRSSKESAFKKGGKGWDRLQTGLSVAGLVFPQADALNALVSVGRAGVARHIKGDTEAAKKHRTAALINAAAIVPGVKEIYTASKAGKILKQAPSTQLKNIVEARKIPKSVKHGVERAATGANIAYWGGTGAQVRKDVTGGYKTPSEKIKDK